MDIVNKFFSNKTPSQILIRYNTFIFFCFFFPKLKRFIKQIDLSQNLKYSIILYFSKYVPYLKNKIDNTVFSFDQNLNSLIEQADLCITRAGASSLAEISLSKKPFIAIPLPTSKDNHQLENANYYKNKGCCWIVNQIDFDKKKFEDLLLNILCNKDEILLKKNNLEKLNYQNTWNNVNQKLLNIINEN